MASCEATLSRSSSFQPSFSHASSSFFLKHHAESSRVYLKSADSLKPLSTEGLSSFNASVFGKTLKIHYLEASSSSVKQFNRFPHTAVAKVSPGAEGRCIRGKCFVVGDNIDTDQIIPAEYLTLVPSNPDEYEKLGSYAMIGLPASYGHFIEEGKTKAEYNVIIGGANFGCGSSREHAPVALGAAGVQAVVAESYARIFFRNSVATGELYPVESEVRLADECRTGDFVTVDLERDLFINHSSGKQYALKPIGDAGPVIDAGGVFAYARKTGMIAASA
ncbi:hypothetical protein O6H91_02G042600 [Diphasiastrum complanatum]|uniref:Uncharacterized protein n=2 Tax=Diphasiastrum complanatum TaxID=34168 RepID=A0ACC2EDR7_DIPCM|nr:hypothetical protein O6H91_02G020200 [Diphasiastrum complanatum]KAJ7564975.1 hypothetical protein O6H91_02G042600 [Diphasiastrum complanatum]